MLEKTNAAMNGDMALVFGGGVHLKRAGNYEEGAADAVTFLRVGNRYRFEQRCKFYRGLRRERVALKRASHLAGGYFSGCGAEVQA